MCFNRHKPMYQLGNSHAVTAQMFGTLNALFQGHYILRQLINLTLQHNLNGQPPVDCKTAKNIVIYQAFTFMVGKGHCPMISKYGPSLSKAVGPVDPSFLVVKISHFKYSTYSESINFTKQKVYVGCQQ